MNKVEICGVDTKDLKVLTEKEKTELLKKYKNGDEKAREKLIEGNLKLVLSVIARFWGRGENMDDLFQVGTIGLIKAIDNFDITQPVRFSTYAVPMIIGEVRRHLRDYGPIRISRSIKDTAYRAMQAKEKLTDSLKREPTVAEIAEDMGVKREDVVLALESIVDPISLYEPVFKDGVDTVYVIDQISDKSESNDWINEIAIKDSINNLSKRERQIMNLRFIRGLTQMEVSKEIGISQAQVSRLEKNVMKRLV